MEFLWFCLGSLAFGLTGLFFGIARGLSARKFFTPLLVVVEKIDDSYMAWDAISDKFIAQNNNEDELMQGLTKDHTKQKIVVITRDTHDKLL